MQREEYVYQAGKVSLLFADSDRSQCRAVELYAQEHAYVELCAAVTDAGQLLDAVQRGLQPQVLVLDVLLKGQHTIPLLQKLAVLGCHPRVILTGMPSLRMQAEHFLTSGINCIIVKPYGLDTLFSEVYHQVAGSPEWAAYCVSERYWELMRGMFYNRRLSGWHYLERILVRTVLQPGAYIAKELYLWAAEGQPASVGMVTASLQRINDSLRRTGPQGYNALCAALGKPAGSRLTNLELIRALSEEISRTIVVTKYELEKEPIP